MSKPTESLTQWSSDTNYASGAASGTPTKVEPSGGRKATGMLPGDRPAAQTINWLISTLYLYVAWLASMFTSADEHVYPTPKARKSVSFGPGKCFPIFSNVSSVPEYPNWQLTVSGTAPHYTGFRWSSEVDLGHLVVPLSDSLPSGATITRVRALVNPGIARATPADRMFLTVHSVEIDQPAALAYALEAAEEDDGTANLQWIDSGVLSLPVDKEHDVGGSPTTTHYTAAIRAGSDGATNLDAFHALIVEYTDAGLRNF